VGGMIRRGFLSTAERKALLSLARDGSAEHRIARANAILLLDDGLSCERVAKVLYLDDDTVRGWRKLHDERGIAGLEQFDAGGSSSRLSAVQEEALNAYVAQDLEGTVAGLKLARYPVQRPLEAGAGACYEVALGRDT
jgi:transposase